MELAETFVRVWSNLKANNQEDSKQESNVRY
jgi:hypothetical protein